MSEFGRSCTVDLGTSMQTHLMTDDDDVLLPLQFHDNGFESYHDILVRFTATVYRARQRQNPAGDYPSSGLTSVAKLVLITCSVIFGVFFLIG
jgi:hypothetical protein